jgi:sulfopropanediol 3-dehydrogenase
VSRSVLKAARAGSAALVDLDRRVADVVTAVIADVADRGDAAVREYSERFDSWSPESFRLSHRDIEAALAQVPAQTLRDIEFAQAQVRTFAEAQLATLGDVEIETLPGVFLGHRNIPISDVGAYVPGGRYPLLASAHMTALTAKVAGVPRVVACTPPDHGRIPPASVAAMHIAGADEILVLGGVQAIAAMALGTETIRPVHFIAGPGNAYVAEAKRQLFGRIGIDLVAGPTEILVIADESVDAFTVAVDLLGQAEHGPDSPAILITPSERLAREVIAEIEALLPGMPTRDNAEPAWRDHGEVIVVDSLDEAFVLADEYASEHVEVLVADPRRALSAMSNYGALFLGDRTSVPYGDKVIGTNHVLPTRKGARYTGGLWVGKFLRTVTFQEIRDDSSSALLGEVCGRLSRAENFEGHARSGDVRAVRFDRSKIAWA